MVNSNIGIRWLSKEKLSQNSRSIFKISAIFNSSIQTSPVYHCDQLWYRKPILFSILKSDFSGCMILWLLGNPKPLAFWNKVATYAHAETKSPHTVVGNDQRSLSPIGDQIFMFNANAKADSGRCWWSELWRQQWWLLLMLLCCCHRTNAKLWTCCCCLRVLAQPLWLLRSTFFFYCHLMMRRCRFLG